MVVTGKQTDSKLTKFKYIINERIVILSFSFLCTKIAKCLYNLIYKHLLKKHYENDMYGGNAFHYFVVCWSTEKHSGL